MSAVRRKKEEMESMDDFVSLLEVLPSPFQSGNPARRGTRSRERTRGWSIPGLLLRRAAAAFLALFFLAGGGLPAPALGNPGTAAGAVASPSPIRIAINVGPKTLPDLPILYAKKHGLFRKYGLEPDFRELSGVRNLVAALISGEAEMANPRGGVLTAIAEGADITVVGVSTPWLPYYFLTRPETATPADLAGKKIVLTSETGLQGTNRFFLEKMGLGDGKGVSILVMPNTSARIAALESGAIAGALLTPPSAMVAMERGLRVFFDFLEAGANAPSSANFISASGQFLREHPDRVRAFLKAVSEASFLMKRDREGTVSLLAEHFSLDQASERKALERSYDAFVLGCLPVVPRLDGEVTGSLLRILGEGNPKAASLRPEQIFDGEPLRILGDEGFFREIHD